MRSLLKACLAVALLTAVSGTVASAEITVSLQAVAEGLTAPMQLISPPDGTKRRFIVEQIGLIKILMPDGKVLEEPFLNIRHKIVRQIPDFDECGLLSMAFHPDYKSNGRFYVRDRKSVV